MNVDASRTILFTNCHFDGIDLSQEPCLETPQLGEGTFECDYCPSQRIFLAGQTETLRAVE